MSSSKMLRNKASAAKVAAQTSPPTITSALAAPRKGRFQRMCKFYVNGKKCPFQYRKGGCWDIHDLDARHTNLAKLNQTSSSTARAHKSNNPVTIRHNNHTTFDASNIKTHEISTLPGTSASKNHGITQIHKNETSAGTSASKNDSSTTRNIEEIKQLVTDMRTISITGGTSSRISQQAVSIFSVSSSPTSQRSAISSEVTMGSTRKVSRRAWDPLPSEWERWGKANLSPEAYAKIVAPHLEDLEDLEPGNVTDAFLKQPIEGYSWITKIDSVPGATTSFHNFGKLPYELREQIWKLAIADDSSTCRVRYEYELEDGWRDDRSLNPTKHVIKSRIVPLSRSPRFLLVNREARSIARDLRVYKWAFWTETSGTRCVFNFENDRLFLHPRCTNEYRRMIQSIPQRQRRMVRKLAVPHKHVMLGYEFKDVLLPIIMGFINLTHIYLIAGDGLEDAFYTRNPRKMHKIKRWNASWWKELCPNRNANPTMEIEFIPAHIAHWMRLDDYLFSKVHDDCYTIV